MIVLVMVCLLSLDCQAGEGVVKQTQELIYAIGNTTTSNGQNAINPFASPPEEVEDTPLISMQDIISKLGMNVYCKYSTKLGKTAIYFWLGCFITVVSQALMALA